LLFVSPDGIHPAGLFLFGFYAKEDKNHFCYSPVAKLIHAFCRRYGRKPSLPGISLWIQEHMVWFIRMRAMASLLLMPPKDG